MLRDLIGALAASGNRFVLTTRYIARAHRLLRDAPSQFEIIHVAPLDAGRDPRHHRAPHEPARSTEDDRARDELARLVHALSDGRPAYARLLADTAAAMRRAAAPIRSARSPRCSRPAARSPTRCRFCYELRLHRARGYGALKAILDILAEEEPLTLTEIALRLQRTPGSTKDYLSWLEDVDLIVSRQKRYSFADPMLRLWVRLHCRPAPPSDDDIAREVHAYVLSRLPRRRARAAMALAAPTDAREIVGDYRDRLGNEC